MIIVYVWQPTKANSLGHAAMLCRAGDAKNKVYISWYPTDDPSWALYFGAAAGKDDWSTVGIAVKSHGADVKEFQKGRRPDLAVTLQHLAEDKVVEAWEHIKGHGKWTLRNHNCAAVCYASLLAGGAPRYNELMNRAEAIKQQHQKEINQGKTAGIPSGGNVLWTQATTKDDVVNVLGSLAKGVLTPLRLYNYATVLSYALKDSPKK